MMPAEIDETVLLASNIFKNVGLNIYLKLKLKWNCS